MGLPGIGWAGGSSLSILLTVFEGQHAPLVPKAKT
jgi:hypothetical protein